MASAKGIKGVIYQPMTHHLELAHISMVIMEQLRFNICGLTSSFIRNSEVDDLEKRIKENISETLQLPVLELSCDAV